MNRDAPIELIGYSATWRDVFAVEADLLRRKLRPWLVGEIEHIGSTAVPGLAAKPVIDIMAPVASLDIARPAIVAVAAAGYCYFPYQAEHMHWFCKPSPALRTHHLHLVPSDSALWHERLAFRDALRQNSALARQYESLKRDLAQRHPHDREAYTDGKSAFVSSVIAAWRGRGDAKA